MFDTRRSVADIKRTKNKSPEDARKTDEHMESWGILIGAYRSLKQ